MSRQATGPHPTHNAPRPDARQPGPRGGPDQNPAAARQRQRAAAAARQIAADPRRARPGPRPAAPASRPGRSSTRPPAAAPPQPGRDPRSPSASVNGAQTRSAPRQRVAVPLQDPPAPARRAAGDAAGQHTATLSTVAPAPPQRGPRPPSRPPSPRRTGARPGGPGDGGRRPGRPGRQGPGRNRRASFLWRYRRVWFLVGVILVTALAGAAWVLTQVPLPPEAALPQTTIIYDAAGNQLATLQGPENRFPVTLDQVPPIVQSAVISAEDRKFFSHGGIDPVGILRATWADVRKKGVTQGGSTITQQYVKQVYVGSDPTLWRKLREAVIAVKLERKLDKVQILERYLNTVYFGRGAYGIQAASRVWFDKDVGQLGLKEASYLVGLIRSPSGGDLISDPALANELRTIVLQAMVDTEVITPAQMAEVEAIALDSYVAERSELDSTVALQGVGAEYYVQYVRDKLIATYSEDFVLRQGLRVQTSLDPELQRQAYEAVYGLLDEPGDPAGSLVAIDQDGQVVAMVGGRDWKQSEVNLAVGAEGGGAGRQGGSTFKPFALAAAVNDGYSLESSFRGPAKIVLPKADRGNDWEVTNYENASFGQVNLIDATVDSVNTVYAQLVDTLGPDRVLDMAQQLGITSELAPVASIALGTQDVSVLEMANAYSTLARGGLRYEPQVITKVTMNDTTLPDTRPKGVRVLEKTEADQVNFALEQVVARGSGTGAQVRNTKVKGKTGTTEDFGDAWFVGSTRSLTVAVWMGYPEGQSQQLLNVHGVKKVNGGSLPARIFQRFLSALPPENDDVATPAPEFEGKPLSSIVRYTTPAAAPSVTPSSGSATSGSSGSGGSTADEVSDSPETGPTTTVVTAGNGGATSGVLVPDPVTGGEVSSANVDSSSTVDTTPSTSRSRSRDSPAPSLPPGVSIP